ncbi:periostin [Octopus bimaculoides]|uniref:FAS1 domain-containing protein n=1 Tax=Octopus bimaculoides TaxID=37653 RepID=A0A0L8HK42_OCTBM|nr:periostin [Octopus bimaculoides]|eukprot:XP_014771688.1 PREDICTED: periostin-like [Octopus bimaculoides]
MIASIMADIPGNIIFLITSLLTLFHPLIIPVESNNNAIVQADKYLLELIKAEGLTKFSGFIQKAKIEESFTSNIARTVFAFTDKAYFELPPERKTSIESMSEKDLEYFVKFFTVYNRRIQSSEIINNGILKSNSKNQNLLFTSRPSLNTNSDNTEQIYINGARIIRSNLNAVNGILHIIDTVLQVTSNNQAIVYLEKPEDSRVKTSKFYKLIKVFSVIEDELRNMNRMTLFVPSDEAMQKVDDKKLEQLSNDKESIKKIIDQSIIRNEVLFTSSTDVRIRGIPSKTVPLLYKNSFDQVSVFSGDSTANIIIGNISVSNGVIHVVDRMLGYVFNSVMEEIRNDVSASKFVQFLSMINIAIINEALKTDDRVTLFVPTNEAFARVPEQTKFLASNPACLEEIVKFHIIRDLKWQLVQIGGEYDAREKMRSMAGYYLKAYNFDYDRYVDSVGVKAKLLSTDIGCTNGLVQKIDRIFGIPDMDIPSLIDNHPWLQEQPYAALQITGLQQELTDNKRIYNSNSRFLSTNYRRCGFQKCDFTVLIPNGTAIEIMMRNHIGKEIWKSPKVLKKVFQRMIFTDQCIFMDSLADGIQNFFSSVGVPVVFQKSQLSQTIRLGHKVAKVLHSDLAATNGIVHIIDQVLFLNDDLLFGNAAQPRLSTVLMIVSLILLLCTHT